MNIAEIKPGMTVTLNKELFQVINCQHAKLGRGGSFVRSKMKSLISGKILEKTLRNSDNVEPAFIEKRKLQFLYKEDSTYHFMNLESYEDLIMDKDKIPELTDWLKENMELEGIFFENRLISLEMASSIELKVVETEPGFKGDTVKQGTKPAKLETGAVVNVPIFINIGELIKVNPYTSEYLGRS